MRTIGIDIGGTKILGAVVDRDGNVLDVERVPSPASPGGFADAVGGLVRTLRARHPDVVACGVGCAGLVTNEGVVRYSPNLPGVIDLPLQTIVAEASGLPSVADNDANVAGYGEVVHGAAAGTRHALMVTLGTGIGGAIISDGRIYRGAYGFAGEIGHFVVDRNGPMCACGERGHWEAIASGNALGRMARERAAARGEATDGVDGHSVSADAQRGDAGALALLDDFADNVAIGLVGLANILDPEVIVIAGGLVELGRMLFDPLERAFLAHLEGAEHRPAITIVPARLGERAGAIGAAALARTLVLPA